MSGKKELKLRLSFTRVVSAEFFKFRTLKTNTILLAVVFVAIIAFGAMAASAASGGIKTPEGGPPISGRSPIDLVLSGANFGVLLLGVLGVLLAAREYASNMIQVSMAAVPSRLPILWAKLIVFTTWALPAVAAACTIAFFVGTKILSSAQVPSVQWTDPNVPRAVLGMACSLVGFGLIGLTLGMLTRSIAGGLATLLGGVLILPALAVVLLPESWSSVLKFLPSNASMAFTSTAPPPGMLSAGAGAAVFGLWVVVAIVASAVVVKLRDV